MATNSLAATLNLFQFWFLNWTRKPAQTTKRRHGDGDNWRPLRWWEDQGFPPAAWVQAQDGERAGLLLLWNHLLCDWNIFSVRELKLRKLVSIRRIQASMNFGRGFPPTRSTLSGESLSRWHHAKILSENAVLCYIFTLYSETDEEKTVRESIQVWYGINSSTAITQSPLLLLICLRWISQKYF